MGHACRVVYAAAVFAIAGSSGGAAEGHRVVVRTYNTYGVAAHDLQTATRTVRAALAATGIDTKWRNCRVVGRPDARLEPCVESVGRDELIVRIVGAASMTHSAEIDITGEDGDAHFTPPTVALGYSLIDIARGTGTLATIFADRVDRLSRALDVDRGTLFGRTVAHEIGHLLLGRQNHSELGLMRGTWTRHTLIENHREDWSFTREEASDMRLALQARSASATARRD